MPFIKIQPKPGIVSQLTQTANEDGWWASNLIRWRMGLLEKIPGWSRLISTPCAAYVRAMHAWLDLLNNKNLLIGTDIGAQIIVNTTLYTMTVEGTPVSGGDTGGGGGGGGTDTTFCNFSITSGTTLVTVGVDASVVVPVNSTVTFKMPVSVGGRVQATGSSVTTVGTGTSFFTFNLSANAVLTESNVFGIPHFSLDGVTRLCTVTLKRHGYSPSGTFHIDQTTSIIANNVYVIFSAGSDVTIATVPTVDTFTFDFGPFASILPSSGAYPIYEGETNNALTGVSSFGVVFTFSNPGTPSVPTPPTIVTPSGSQVWYTDNLGENGLAVYAGSPVLVYRPPIENGAVLSVVGGLTPPTAPQVNSGMFTAMPQAQIVVWGTEATLGSGTIDPLLIRFSDAGTYDTWEATVTNQAGSYRLSRGSKVIGGTQAPQTTLLWTDTDLWGMSYISPPLVYGFNIMGVGCGLVAPKAFATLGRNTFWQSDQGFWMVGDQGAQPLQCPVWDAFFLDLDTTNIHKCFGAADHASNEVFFFYPSLQTAPDLPANSVQYSQDFAALTWSELNVTATVSATLAPDGTATATQLVENSLNGFHYVNQIIGKGAQILSVVASIYCHKDSSRNVGITLNNHGVGSATAIFNPSTGATVATALNGIGFSVLSVSATTDTLATGIAGNGWLRYSLFVTTDVSNVITYQIDNANGSSFSYAGGGASGAIIWGAQLSLQPLTDYSPTTIVAGNECSRYAKYNVLEGLWDISQPGEGLPSLPRTAWCEENIFGAPLGADHNYLIQQHEIGFDDDGEPMRNVYAETGYGRMQQGETIISIDQCQPDMKWLGEGGAVDVVLKTVQYPGGPITEYGPYSVTPTTQFFSTRVRAKQVALRYEWNAIEGFSARVGATTFRTKPAGTRP